MPKTFIEFIKMLAKKGGVNIDENEDFTNELSAPAFSSNTISEALEKAIDNGLLSMEVAKNNHPELKKVYFAQAYNGLDTELNDTMTELGITDDVKNVILNERSSPKRASLLAKKIKELEAKKKESTNDEFRNSTQKQLNELHAALAAEKAGIQKIKDDYENQINEIYTENEVDFMLANYKTVLDDLPPLARKSALKSLIKKELQDREAEFKLDSNKALILRRKDGTNVFGDDNREINPQILIDKVLSSNKVLKVTDSAPKNGQNNTAQNGQPTATVIANDNGNNNGGQGKQPNLALSAILNKSLNDLQQSEKAGIM